MPIVWERAPQDAVQAGMDAYQAAVYQAIYALALRRKPEIENWMKENAPWVDRTGNARQSLHVVVEATVQYITLGLWHGMWYGIYLENSNAGTYAILGPAVDHWTPILMADIQAVLQ